MEGAVPIWQNIHIFTRNEYEKCSCPLNETLHLQNPPRSPLLSPCRALPLVGFLKITEFTFQSSALSKTTPFPKKTTEILLHVSRAGNGSEVDPEKTLEKSDNQV